MVGVNVTEMLQVALTATLEQVFVSEKDEALAPLTVTPEIDSAVVPELVMTTV